MLKISTVNLLIGFGAGLLGGVVASSLLSARNSTAPAMISGAADQATPILGVPLSQGGRLPRELEPCRPALYLYCADVLPGDGRYMTCLKEHRNEISVECAKTIDDEKVNALGKGNK